MTERSTYEARHEQSKADAAVYPVTPDVAKAVADPKILHEEPKPKRRGRDHINVDSLIFQLQQDAEGVRELTSGQRKSIEILLNKSLPNLQATTISGDNSEDPVRTVSRIELVDLVSSPSRTTP